MKHDFAYGIIPMYRSSNGIELLLIQKNEGHWGFPKGHAEAGELPLETAKRELKEETGIVNAEIDESTTFTEEYEVVLEGQKVPKTVIYYPAIIADKQVSIQEIELKDSAWVSYDQAIERVTYNVTKKLLAEFKEYFMSVAAAEMH